MAKLDELLKLRDSLFPKEEETSLLPNPNLPDSGGEVESEPDLNALAALETPELDAQDLKSELANKEVSNPYTESKEDKVVKSIADIRKMDDSNSPEKIASPEIKPETPEESAQEAPSKLNELESIYKELEALKGTKGDARNKDALMTLAKGLINSMGHFGASNANLALGTKAIKQGDIIDDKLFTGRYKQDVDELMGKIQAQQSSAKDKELSDYRNRQLDIQDQSRKDRLKESQADRLNKLDVEKIKSGGKAVMTKGREEADKAFGKSYTEFATGGKEAVEGNIADLKKALNILKTNKGIFSGPIDKGVEIIDSPVLRKALNPKAQEVKNLVNTVSMQDLKRILGGQFAEREGKMLMDAAFDPATGEKEAAEKLETLIGKIETAQKSMQKASKYFEKEGSLVRYKATGEKDSPQSDTVMMIAPNGQRKAVKREMVQKYLDKGAKLAE